ncbi:uncharacterized protein LOC122536162 isoform X2 [Frieseomelitta varia]|uniref:uncharacterized protein LOC122536162 isoform X2 n=1 Tax=Frieseomelitta varia TaxID=561572 RepID=UPI001CB688E1|nr:uncharacterized protein LOC122536162 isoform X2 [Frieseomelitta varia]
MTMTMDVAIKCFDSLHSSQTSTFESLESLYQYHKPRLISLIFLVLLITTAIVSVCVQRFDYSDIVRFSRLWFYCFGNGLLYDDSWVDNDDDDDEDEFMHRVAEWSNQLSFGVRCSVTNKSM